MTGQHPRESNERLEFLGDSVLGLVTSEFLYRRHPEEHEGQLTKTKSLLVSKAILSRRALKMGLGRYVLLSHSEVESGGRQRLSILADAFESVLGAIYLDQGFDTARQFIHKHLLSESDDIVADKRHTNYKSHLQEYVQSTYRTHPVYRIRSEYGPDHSKHFMVEVMVGRRTLGEGRGHNKKEAEQAAARDALDRVQETRRGRGSDELDAGDERPVRRERSEGREPAERDEDVAEPGERERGSRSRRRRTERAPEPEEAPSPDVASGPEQTHEDSTLDAGDDRRRRRGRRPRGAREHLRETREEPSDRDAVGEPPAGSGSGPAPAERGDNRFPERDASEAEAARSTPSAPVEGPSGTDTGMPGDVGRAQEWGRGRRRSGSSSSAAPASADPIEHVPVVEAIVDPYELDDAAPVEPTESARAPREPVEVAETDAADGDDESRQARIDELEQALAGFGRRSQKYGRRGRRR